MKHKIRFAISSKRKFSDARAAIPSMVFRIYDFNYKDRWIFGNYVVEDRRNKPVVYFLKSKISGSLMDLTG